MEDEQKKKKILLVEDDKFVSDLYVKVLGEAGYEMVSATDGEMALAKGEADDYDLVLLDIMLPKLTGLEVLKTYREEGKRTKNTPVYLLTNLGEENVAKEAFKLGADGYLLKAKYLPQQLVEEINNHFEKQQNSGNNSISIVE